MRLYASPLRQTLTRPRKRSFLVGQGRSREPNRTPLDVEVSTE